MKNWEILCCLMLTIVLVLAVGISHLRGKRERKLINRRLEDLSE